MSRALSELTESGSVPQQLGHLCNFRKFTADHSDHSDHSDHKVVRLIVSQCQFPAIHSEHHDCGCKCQTFIPVDQGVILTDGEQQGSRLGMQIGICICTKRRGPRACHRRFEQTCVAQRHIASNDSCCKPKDFLQGQVDHWPSRSRASAYLGNSESITCSIRAARLERSMYSRSAAMMTSCCERCSISAVRASAAESPQKPGFRDTLDKCMVSP